MLFVFSALMAWGFLDRLTGNSWTVMNTEWANSLLNIIPTVPFAWFGVSLVLWVLFSFVLYQYSQYLQRKSTGVTTVKIRFDKKVFVDKVYELISTKARTYEDRSISTLGYEVATFTYPEYDWGPNNGVPQIVLEFDVTNSYLLTAQITYNRREANNKILAFNSRDLQQRLIDEFNDMKIWDAAGEDHSAMALAIDRRRALEDEEEAEEAEE
jgi:hypothetical protein